MVPVEQDQRTLAHNDEKRVPQFEDFGDREERHPKNDSPRPVVILAWLTDVLERACRRKPVSEARTDCSGTKSNPLKNARDKASVGRQNAAREI